HFAFIHSVDSVKLATALSNRISNLALASPIPIPHPPSPIPQSILSECNASGEESKSGFRMARCESDQQVLETFSRKVQQIAGLPCTARVRAIALARRVPIILVGGAVRDALLGKAGHDLDFAVQGDAVRMARLVADRLGGAFYLMDAERGTARVITAQEGQPPFHLDFALCRGADWNEDLFKRDFSINAIALDLANSAILDPTR